MYVMSLYSLQQVADAGITIIMLVAFSLVIAGSSVYIVNERTNGEKLQQKICGVSHKTYWGVSFVWDLSVKKFSIFGILYQTHYILHILFIYKYITLI